MNDKVGYAAVLALMMLCVGEALGNIAPDFSDIAYYTAVLDGSIADGVVAFLVYDVFPAVQYAIVGLVIGLIWWATENAKLTLRVGVWLLSIIYVVSTVLLFGLFYQLLPDYSILIDIVTCVSCVLALLSIEGALTWRNVKGFFTKSYRR